MNEIFSEEEASTCEVVLVVEAPDFTLKTKVDQGFLYWGAKELKAHLPIPSAVTLVLIWHEGVDPADRDRIVAECQRRKIRVIEHESSLVSLSQRIKPFLVESSFIRPAPTSPQERADLGGYQSFRGKIPRSSRTEFIERLQEEYNYQAEVNARSKAGRKLRKLIFKPFQEPQPPADWRISTQRLQLIEHLNLLKESLVRTSGKDGQEVLSHASVVTAPILKALGLKRKKGTVTAERLVDEIEQISRHVCEFDAHQIKLTKEVLGF